MKNSLIFLLLCILLYKPTLQQQCLPNILLDEFSSPIQNFLGGAKSFTPLCQSQTMSNTLAIISVNSTCTFNSDFLPNGQCLPLYYDALIIKAYSSISFSRMTPSIMVNDSQNGMIEMKFPEIILTTLPQYYILDLLWIQKGFNDLICQIRFGGFDAGTIYFITEMGVSNLFCLNVIPNTNSVTDTNSVAVTNSVTPTDSVTNSVNPTDSVTNSVTETNSVT